MRDMPPNPALRARRVPPAQPATDRAQALLWGASPSDVLARIVPDDPLGLRALVGARLRERALLCDAERVLLISQVQCALQASSWRGQVELSSWLRDRIEEALAITIAEDSSPSELQPFAAPLELDARTLAAACKSFNVLPFEQRAAFFALVLDSTGVDRTARSQGRSLPELARRARPALQLFLRAAAPASPAPANATS